MIQALDSIEMHKWLPLWQAYQAFYKTSLTEAVNQYTWQRLTDASYEHMYGFAVCMGHRVVGIVHVIEHESCWTERPYAYLQDLYVDPSVRGQGIARRLIQHVGQYCQTRCDRVYWLTHEDNTTARALYDKLAVNTGFIQYRLKAL